MSQTQRHLLPLVPSGESQRAKKGKCTVLLCVSKHNKSAAALKGRMTRTFFFFIPLCLLFSLHISSSICFLRCCILLQRILHRWGSIKLHLICLHASSRLLLLLFFFPRPFCRSSGSPGWKTLLGLFRVSPYRRETHGSPAPSPSSGGIRRNWFVLLCLPSLLLPPLSSTRPPPLLLSLPSLPGGGRREAGRYQHV